MTIGPAGPPPMPANEAGAECSGGWIAPDGRFYPAPRYHHNLVAYELRSAGDGPVEPWDMRDGWIQVKAHGEVLALPDRLTQAQIDTLGDMLQAAPESLYRSQMLESLRTLRELEMCR